MTTLQNLDIKSIITGLMSSGLSAPDIADGLDHRVSVRTIYRWAKGESEPQQTSDVDALKKLAAKHKVGF
jgi:hypothetical protein